MPNFGFNKFLHEIGTYEVILLLLMIFYQFWIIKIIKVLSKDNDNDNSSVSYLDAVSKAVKQLTLKAVDDKLINFRHIADKVYK